MRCPLLTCDVCPWDPRLGVGDVPSQSPSTPPCPHDRRVRLLGSCALRGSGWCSVAPRTPRPTSSCAPGPAQPQDGRVVTVSAPRWKPPAGVEHLLADAYRDAVAAANARQAKSMALPAILARGTMAAGGGDPRRAHRPQVDADHRPRSGDRREHSRHGRALGRGPGPRTLLLKDQCRCRRHRARSRAWAPHSRAVGMPQGARVTGTAEPPSSLPRTRPRGLLPHPTGECRRGRRVRTDRNAPRLGLGLAGAGGPSNRR